MPRRRPPTDAALLSKRKECLVPVTAAASDPIFEATSAVEVNGATLAYHQIGAGEPVVFVHGGLSDFRTWQQQLPAIGQRYRAVSYGRRYARPNADIEPGSDDQMLPHVDAKQSTRRSSTSSTVANHSHCAHETLLAGVSRVLLLWPPREAELIGTQVAARGRLRLA
jgi:hypothetical protein